MSETYIEYKEYQIGDFHLSLEEDGWWFATKDNVTGAGRTPSDAIAHALGKIARNEGSWW